MRRAAGRAEASAVMADLGAFAVDPNQREARTLAVQPRVRRHAQSVGAARDPEFARPHHDRTVAGTDDCAGRDSLGRGRETAPQLRDRSRAMIAFEETGGERAERPRARCGERVRPAHPRSTVPALRGGRRRPADLSRHREVGEGSAACECDGAEAADDERGDRDERPQRRLRRTPGAQQTDGGAAPVDRLGLAPRRPFIAEPARRRFRPRRFGYARREPARTARGRSWRRPSRNTRRTRARRAGRSRSETRRC